MSAHLTSEEAWAAVVRVRPLIERQARRRVRHHAVGSSHEDVVGAAVLRCHRIVMTWDPARCSLVAWAGMAARYAVGNVALEQVPLGSRKGDVVAYACRMGWDEAVAALGRSPTADELADYASPHVAGRYRTHSNGRALSIERVSWWLATGDVESSVSTSRLLTRDGMGTETLLDLVPDEQGQPADEALEDRRRRRQLARALDHMARVDERLGYIARRHHIDGASGAQIGRELGISRERVRQLLAEVLVQLRDRLTRPPMLRALPSLQIPQDLPPAPPVEVGPGGQLQMFRRTHG